MVDEESHEMQLQLNAKKWYQYNANFRQNPTMSRRLFPFKMPLELELNPQLNAHIQRVEIGVKDDHVSKMSLKCPSRSNSLVSYFPTHLILSSPTSSAMRHYRFLSPVCSLITVPQPAHVTKEAPPGHAAPPSTSGYRPTQR